LHGTQNFLNDLSDLGLHLEPFEFFDLELLVLGHRIKLMRFNYNLLGIKMQASQQWQSLFYNPYASLADLAEVILYGVY
jgi:hypothetical protein